MFSLDGIATITVLSFTGHFYHSFFLITVAHHSSDPVTWRERIYKN